MTGTLLSLTTELRNAGEFINNKFRLSTDNLTGDIYDIITFGVLVDMRFNSTYTLTSEELFSLDIMINDIMKTSSFISKLKKTNIQYGSNS